MSLGYVLQQAGDKIGLNPNVPSQRNVLLRFANEAAVELYTQSDMAGSLFEQVFKVNGDQTIALPAYVGQIRAARESDTWIPWHLNQMRPRYNESNWQDTWRNWRLKGIQPLEATIRNESILTVTVSVIENPPIVVTITGSTDTAAKIVESVAMDSLVKTTVNQFTSVASIIKNIVNACNVLITDVDGLILAVINNDLLRSQYQIVDVSTCPWLNNDGGVLDHYMEIMFKKTLPWYKDDADEFPSNYNYDNVWVNKILQIYYEENANVQLALAYSTKATAMLAQIHEDANKATEDVVALCFNPHDSLQPRIRGTNRQRYGNSMMGGPYGYY